MGDLHEVLQSRVGSIISAATGVMMAIFGAGNVSRSRVLVVEDEGLVLGFVTRALRRLDFEVIAATNATRAYNLFQRHASELALIIVALSLPGMGGDEFIATLPTLAPRVPVIFTTCVGQRGQDLHGPILQKPFSAAALEPAVCANSLARPSGELL